MASLAGLLRRCWTVCGSSSTAGRASINQQQLQGCAFIRTYQLSTTARRDAKIKAREMRFQKNELLRQNRRNPQLERAARLRRCTYQSTFKLTMTLLSLLTLTHSLSPAVVVPLNEVEAEWREHGGKQHLERIGHHYNLFADLYPSPFQPRGFLRVVYRESAAEVHTGNILTASQTVSRPDVYLPPDLPPGAYSSLVFTNPDGHLCSGEKEVLHWMM